MPTRREVLLRHANQYLKVLEEVSDLDEVSDKMRGEKLTELELMWSQIAKARAWATKYAQTDRAAKELIESFFEAGVEIAQVRAETRRALRELNDSILAEHQKRK